MAAQTAFAAELKRWRKKLNMTQKEAATALDVKYDSIRAWELGSMEPGTPGPIRRVMKLLLDEAKTDASAR